MQVSNRALSLQWWVGLSERERLETIVEWRNETKDSRADWPLGLISKSTSTIELIWREKVKNINMRKINLGPVVMVSDPCYDDPTWCQAKIEGVKPGDYEVVCEKFDTGDWGERNSRLIAVHEDHVGGDLKWEFSPSEIGVDSGQAGIFDMSTYRVQGLKMEIPKPMPGVDIELIASMSKDDDWYLKMCQMTLSEDGWGAYDKGAVCRSGYGDGAYTLYLGKSDDQIVAIMIDFHVVESDEDEEY